MIKAVFFDFDGVLVESLDIKNKAFAGLFERESADARRAIMDYHLAHAGVSRYDKFRYFYKEILKRPLSEKEFAWLCERFSALAAGNVIKAPYVKGAREFLDGFHKRYALYVVSATPREEIAGIVKRRGMSGYFRAVYGAPDAKKDVVKKVIADEGMDPADAVYVGDALSDYEAAVSNGVGFIARLAGGTDVFEGRDCPKMKDLEGLAEVIAGWRR